MAAAPFAPMAIHGHLRRPHPWSSPPLSSGSDSMIAALFSSGSIPSSSKAHPISLLSALLRAIRHPIGETSSSPKSWSTAGDFSSSSRVLPQLGPPHHRRRPQDPHHLPHTYARALILSSSPPVFLPHILHVATDDIDCIFLLLPGSDGNAPSSPPTPSTPSRPPPVARPLKNTTGTMRSGKKDAATGLVSLVVPVSLIIGLGSLLIHVAGLLCFSPLLNHLPPPLNLAGPPGNRPPPISSTPSPRSPALSS